MGKINASIPKNMEPDTLNLDRALELIAVRLEKLNEKKGTKKQRKKSAKKKNLKENKQSKPASKA